jgi:hypothetical protein
MSSCAAMSEGAGRRVLITGWGNAGAGRTKYVTAHAVDATQAGERLAVCGSPVFDVDVDHPWVVRDAADSAGCRRCIAALA